MLLFVASFGQGCGKERIKAEVSRSESEVKFDKRDSVMYGFLY